MILVFLEVLVTVPLLIYHLLKFQLKRLYVCYYFLVDLIIIFAIIDKLQPEYFLDLDPKVPFQFVLYLPVALLGVDHLRKLLPEFLVGLLEHLVVEEGFQSVHVLRVDVLLHHVRHLARRHEVKRAVLLHLALEYVLEQGLVFVVLDARQARARERNLVRVVRLLVRVLVAAATEEAAFLMELQEVLRVGYSKG